VSKKVLVAFATTYGSTEEVAEAIAETMREGGAAVDVQPMKAVAALEDYAAVVFGAPFFIGRWHKDVQRFLEKHQSALVDRPVAVFALGPTSTTEEDMVGSIKQMDNALANYPWLSPVAVEMFIGKYDPDKLTLPHKLLTIPPASPLNGMPASDNRDWDAIRTWAASVGEKL
jgi:menaquinone-dependent protoporphyrinogen oxidase